MEKNMPYRVYIKRFDDCKTLNDYDKRKKTITVIIPDDDPRIARNKRIDSKVWKSYGNEWRLRTKYWPESGLSCYSVRTCELGYYALADNRERRFILRDDALQWVLENYNNDNNDH